MHPHRQVEKSFPLQLETSGDEDLDTPDCCIGGCSHQAGRSCGGGVQEGKTQGGRQGGREGLEGKKNKADLEVGLDWLKLKGKVGWK